MYLKVFEKLWVRIFILEIWVCFSGPLILTGHVPTAYSKIHTPPPSPAFTAIEKRVQQIEFCPLS